MNRNTISKEVEFWQTLGDQWPDEELILPVRMEQFIEETLGTHLWSKQREIVESVEHHQRTAVRSAHTVGKTFTVAHIAVSYLQTHPHSIVLTTAPSATQVREVTWRNIRSTAAAATGKLHGKKGHPLQTKWDIEPDWYALGVSPGKNNSGLQGYHAASGDILVIIDEAAGVGEHIYEQVEGLMTGSGARLVLIGNPTSITGSFRRAFHEARELYNTIKISAEDTPNFTTFGITRQDIEENTWEAKITAPLPYPALVDPRWAYTQVALNGADNPAVTSRVWADFPTGGDFTLIALSDIERSENRDDCETTGKPVVGIDVARYGDDETVLWLRHGEETLGWKAFTGADFNTAAGLLSQLLDDHDLGVQDVQLNVDETGLGGGFVDNARRLGYKVEGVSFGSASSDPEQWQYVLDEYWWQLSERFKQGRIGLNGNYDDMTKSQLSDIRYDYRNGRLKPRIESKSTAKKRGRKSPDRAEAMMLAYATITPSKPQHAKVSRAALGGTVIKSAWMTGAPKKTPRR